MDTIGDRICNLRKLFRLTQCQLAENIHLSDKVISKWENGESKPNIDDAKMLSQFFGVTLDYLISGRPTKQDDAVLSKTPTEDELILDAKNDFIKKCNAIIRNNNLNKFKDKIFPTNRCNYYLKKYIPTEYASIGIFHPLVSKKTEAYGLGIDLKALLSFDDFELFEKVISLNLPFCNKGKIINFVKDDLLSYKDIDKLNDVRFYQFLANQDILIKQSLERNGYTFEEYLKANGLDSCQSRYKKILSDALNNLDRKNPNYWEIVKVLIENGAFVRKMIGGHLDNNYCLHFEYADDIFVTEILHDTALSKCKNII